MTTADDRDDELLDRMGDGVAPASPEEAAARAPYERLAGQLQALDPRDPPAGWERRLDARLREARAREQRRRWWLIGGGVAAAAAVAAAVVLWPRPAPAPVRPVTVAVIAADGAARRGDAAVGDAVQIAVDRAQAQTELRVYRDTTLVTRCPGADACQISARSIRLELRLTDVGRYRVVTMTSASAIPAPGAGLDADLLAARSAGATIVLPAPIVVRP
ncbi:MAG: hypothetical protein IPL61_25855 [Myxococcales bacterium]|nr:hypothetical protein [Myxococcales bacterium]